MPEAIFSHKRKRYRVTGGWDGESGSYAGPDAVLLTVEYEDGTEIPGTDIMPGMVQVGVSRDLHDAAERALRKELAAESRREPRLLIDMYR